MVVGKNKETTAVHQMTLEPNDPWTKYRVSQPATPPLSPINAKKFRLGGFSLCRTLLHFFVWEQGGWGFPMPKLQLAWSVEKGANLSISNLLKFCFCPFPCVFQSICLVDLWISSWLGTSQYHREWTAPPDSARIFIHGWLFGCNVSLKLIKIHPHRNKIICLLSFPSS